MAEKHTCPRRRENGTDRADSPLRGSGPNLDTYRKGHGLVGQARGCSYCGSMHPDDFMQAVRDGMQIGPTDKSYKFYLHEPLTAEQRAERRQQQIGRYVAMGISEAEATEQADADPILGTGAGLGKFYTQHLSEEQGHEFRRLWLAGEVNFGYPGRPYVAIFLPGPSTQPSAEA